MTNERIDVLAVTPRHIAAHLYGNGMRCNCDLDHWEPERNTGHSHVCRIHKAALSASNDLKANVAAALALVSGG